MPRVCTICTHRDLKRITEDLMRRTPYRIIQTRYEVSKSSLARHVSQHVSKALRKLVSAEMSVPDAAAIAEPVLKQMQKLHVRTSRILQEAELTEGHATALCAIRECRRNLELVAKYGSLDPHAVGETPGALQVTMVYAERAVVAPGYVAN